jgi:hypothetical protein
MLMAFFHVCKMMEIHHKKIPITSFIFILNYQKNWIRFIMIPKLKLKKLSKTFDVILNYVFNVEIIRIIFHFLLIKMFNHK